MPSEPGKATGEITQVTARELKQIIKEVVIEGGLEIMVWGPPGIGKSSIVRQVADEQGMKVFELRLAYYEEPDLLGIPVKDGDGFRFVKYNDLPKDSNERGIFFLDELTHAKPHIQGLIFQLLLDKKIEDYRVPEGWQYFIGASNRVMDRSISYEMPSGLRTRFRGGHYELIPDFESWKEWAVKNGISGVLISFLEKMVKDDKKPWLYHDEGEVILTPRVWATGVNYALQLEEP